MGSAFQFSGSLSVNTTANPDANGPSDPTGYGILEQSFDCDVTDQNETVTVGISTLAVSVTNPNITVPYLQWVITNRTNGQTIASFFTSSPYTQTFTLAPGQYRFNVVIVGILDTNNTDAISATFTDTISFSNLQIQPGALEAVPLLPASPGVFTHVPRRCWYDPPTASEFSFQMTGNSLFTQIFNFPTGFSSAFEVLAEGQSLGSFTTDQSVNFLDLLGHGVSAFRVRHITPQVDTNNARAFPIQLDFATETADFLMIPSPGVIPSQNSAGDWVVHFAGVLQQSIDLLNWGDVPGSPASPLLVPKAGAPPKLFFRARQEDAPPLPAARPQVKSTVDPISGPDRRAAAKLHSGRVNGQSNERAGSTAR